MQLYVPLFQLFIKLKKRGFFKLVNGFFKPTSVRRFVNFEHKDILIIYNNIIRGIFFYYSISSNRKNIRRLLYGLKASCALTLAFKFKIYYRSKVYNKLGSGLSHKNVKQKIFFHHNSINKNLNNPLKTDFLFYQKYLCPKFFYVCKFYRIMAIYKLGFISFWSMQSVLFNRK